MSSGRILDNGTKANDTIAYYSGGGGSGGSGSLVASTLTVSSINGLLGPSGSVTFDGPLLMTNGGIAMNLDSIIWAAGAPGDTLAWNGNDGQIAGVSTINGAPYPPAAAGLSVQSVSMLNTGVAILPQNSEGGPVPITQPFSTIVGKLYQASIKVTSETLQPAGNPAASDHYSFVDPSAGIALTRSYAELSSIQVGGNPRGQTVYFNFHATTAASQLTAYNNVGTTQSTIIGFDNSYGCQIVRLT